MSTTPIEKCSLTPDTELTIKLAKEKGWSRFLIFPNGSLIGTSPDGIEDEPVPNFGRILKDAAPDLLNVAELGYELSSWTACINWRGGENSEFRPLGT